MDRRRRSVFIVVWTLPLPRPGLLIATFLFLALMGVGGLAGAQRGPAGASSTATPTPTPTPSPTAILVVGADVVQPGEVRITGRLAQIGYSTVIVSSSRLTRGHLRHARLVLVASSVTRVPPSLRHARVPVVAWGPHLFRDLGFTFEREGMDYGAVTGESELLINDDIHALAAGRSGIVKVTGTPTTLAWGVLSTNAIHIASLRNDVGRWAVFGYERDTAMAGMMAPERRAGMFMTDGTATQLTADGWALFDAAVAWTTSSSYPPTCGQEAFDYCTANNLCGQTITCLAGSPAIPTPFPCPACTVPTPTPTPQTCVPRGCDGRCGEVDDCGETIWCGECSTPAPTETPTPGPTSEPTPTPPPSGHPICGAEAFAYCQAHDLCGQTITCLTPLQGMATPFPCPACPTPTPTPTPPPPDPTETPEPTGTPSPTPYVPPGCGDGICSDVEDCSICPKDCGAKLNFTMAPNPVTVGQTVTFTPDASTLDVDQWFSWDFGNATHETGHPGGAPTQYAYPAYGTFNVVLAGTERVCGSVQVSEARQMRVTSIDLLPPVADAGGPYVAKEGVPVVLNASGTTDPNGEETIAKYQWEINDPFSRVLRRVSGKVVSWVFTSAGEYTVKLTVTDISNRSSTDTAVVKVERNSQFETYTITHEIHYDAQYDQLIALGVLIIDPTCSCASTYSAMVRGSLKDPTGAVVFTTGDAYFTHLRHVVDRPMKGVWTLEAQYYLKPRRGDHPPREYSGLQQASKDIGAPSPTPPPTPGPTPLPGPAPVIGISGPTTAWDMPHDIDDPYHSRRFVLRAIGAQPPYVWRIARGADKIRLIALRHDGAEAEFETLRKSEAENDVAIVAMAAANSSDPHYMTIRRPTRMEFFDESTSRRERDSQVGYHTVLRYRLNDQFDTVVTGDILVQEQLDPPIRVDPATNWDVIRKISPAPPNRLDPSDIADHVAMVCSEPACVPKTLDPDDWFNGPAARTQVKYYPQRFYVGAAGSMLIQTDNLTFHRAIGSHQNVRSPAP